MDHLKKFEKTYRDVQKTLQNKDLFRDSGLSGPVSLVDALRMDMTCLAEGSGKIGWPATAWWWYVEDFFRPVGRSDLRHLMPKEEELDPWKDPVFRLPLVGTPDGRRTLTEFWESLGYETLRKERRSGRLAEKKAFHAGFEIPSTPSDEWLGLPKEFLTGKTNATEICKDPAIVDKLDAILEDLKPPSNDDSATAATAAPAAEAKPSLERFQQMHPLTEMLLDAEQDNYSPHCLSIGPDDEVSAEILKLQEALLQQMLSNRSLARGLCKAALKECKFERKQAARKERIEREIQKCQKIVEGYEKKRKEEAPKTEEALPPQNFPLAEGPKPDVLTIALSVPPPTTLMPHTPSHFEQIPSTPTVPQKESVASKRYASITIARFRRHACRCVEMCDVCGTRTATTSLQTCCHCGIHVHPLCYNTSPSTEDGLWWCLPCRIYHERQRDLQIKSTRQKSGGAHSVECKVCPNTGGAYQRTPDSKAWIHTICSLALSDPSLKSTAVPKKCSICGKLKGKVFPCQTKGCTSVMHASCARADGKLTMRTPSNPHEMPQITTFLCAECVMQSSSKERCGDPCTPNVVAVDPGTRTIAIKRGRGLARLDEPLLADSDVLSNEDATSGRIASRTRAKSLKSEPERPKSTNKRGRPANPHKQRRRLKKEQPMQGLPSLEDREPRRMTRSMK